jgi:hypothetical protein
MTTPNMVVDMPNPVCKLDGTVVFEAPQIMACFKEHYEESFNYNPEDVSYDTDHWDRFNFGSEPQETIEELSYGLT